MESVPFRKNGIVTTMCAVGPALLLALQAGANPGRTRQALMGGFASCRILEVDGGLMNRPDFNPCFRDPLRPAGLNLALRVAARVQPVLAGALETLADHTIGQPA